MEGPLNGTCWKINLESLGWGLRPPHLPWKIPELLKLRWVGEGGLCPRWAPSQLEDQMPVLPSAPEGWWGDSSIG